MSVDVRAAVAFVKLFVQRSKVEEREVRESGVLDNDDEVHICSV